MKRSEALSIIEDIVYELNVEADECRGTADLILSQLEEAGMRPPYDMRSDEYDWEEEEPPVPTLALQDFALSQSEIENESGNIFKYTAHLTVRAGRCPALHVNKGIPVLNVDGIVRAARPEEIRVLIKELIK